MPRLIRGCVGGSFRSADLTRAARRVGNASPSIIPTRRHAVSVELGKQRRRTDLSRGVLPGSVEAPTPLFAASCVGLRRSRLRLLLDCHGDVAVVALGRRRLTQLLMVSLPRLLPAQLLSVSTLAARERLVGGVLGAAVTALVQPAAIDVLHVSPLATVEMVRQLQLCMRVGSGGGDSVTAVQHCLQQISEHLTCHVEQFGPAALPLLSAVARAGGAVAFRKLSVEHANQLFNGVASQAGLLDSDVALPAAPPTFSSGAPRGTSGPVTAKSIAEVHAEVDVNMVADLLSAVARAGRKCAPLTAALCKRLACRLEDVDDQRLGGLALALGKGESPDDYILLHALCHRATCVMDSLDDACIVSLLKAAASFDQTDEAFLDAASQRLIVGAARLPPTRAADVIYSLGALKVADAPLLDALCESLTPRARELTEPDVVRCLRGLVRLKHGHPGFLRALQPEIDRQKRRLNPLSLSNVISAMSLFSDVVDERVFLGLLEVATDRIQRLSSTSVQHVLTGLCRMQGRLTTEEMRPPLEAVCKYLATPTVARQLTPVQTIGALTAMSKLRCRDLVATSVLLSVLVGRSNDVLWRSAPSVNFYMHHNPSPCVSPPFESEKCLTLLRKSLDASHWVEIVQGIHRLELAGAVPLALSRLVYEQLLQPQLHDLRAREIIAVARALGASRSGGDADTSWKEEVVRSCLEGLRRHGHFLEMSWYSVLPFKLLCLEIDIGVFGSRKLVEILNPSQLEYAERLRSLTYEECETNRIIREAEKEGVAPPTSVELPPSVHEQSYWHGFPVEMLVTSPRGMATGQ